MTAEALKYVDENKESPFLMMVNFNLPHYPEQADEKFVKRYADLEMPRSSYAAVVSTVDDRIGRIVKKLEDLKLREKTVLIFMSDNGHSAENKGHFRWRITKAATRKATTTAPRAAVEIPANG